MDRKRSTILFGALIGGLTSLPVMALLFLGWQLAELPFVPFDMFDWLARNLPGDIITFGIDLIVNLIINLNDLLNLGSTSGIAKTVEQLLALGMALGGGVLLGALVAWLRDRQDQPDWQIGAGLGLANFVLVAAVELSLGFLDQPLLALLWLALIFGGWGVALSQLMRTFVAPAALEPEAAQDTGRRDLLVKIAGGSVLAAAGAWGLGRWLGAGAKETGAGQPLASVATPTPEPSATATSAAGETSTPQATATATQRDQVSPAPGTRPELTPNEDFYRIDINTRPVRIEGDSWELKVEGLFDDPRPLTIADLMAYPAITQPVTMSCISNRIGGDLISTSNWTGTRLREVLKDLGLRPEAQELYVEGADGFYESVAMEDLMDPRVLLVYGMNGETLPVEHGYPLRIYIPNRYGMKQPKWITRIEAIDEQGPGYWVDRGWSAEARPKIVSVIDTVAEEAAEDGKIPIGGIAWAGDRGIQKVELQVDDGEWVDATLRTPPLSQLTWVQWRYDWPMSSGSHTFRVRATDGTGALQVEEETDLRPDGATGYHEKRVRI